MKRGQLTVEFLLMLSILLLILVALFYTSKTSEAGVAQTKVKGEATGTLKDLSAAAKEVYAQGSGAKKQVYITIPEGYEPEKSFIGNRSIKIRVAGSDYVDTEQFDLRGTLPASTGGHWTWVVSEGNGVRIGYAMVEVERSAIVADMEPGMQKSSSLRIRNIWPSGINLTLTQKWPQDVDLDVIPQASAVKPGQYADVTFIFSADENTLGLFVGELQIAASDGKLEEYVNVPITVVIQGKDYGGKKKQLFVIPQMLNETLALNSSVSREFQVCTDTVTSVPSVKLTASPGEPGSWVKGLEPIGGIGLDSCAGKLLNITTPIDADLGVYEGFVNFSGGNVSDTLKLSLTIGGIPKDATGPDVQNISLANRTFGGQAATIIARAVDNRSRIKKCELKVDNSTWTLMNPTDGTFDNSTEEIAFTYPKGFAGGKHIAFIRCTDADNNLGLTKNESLTIMKELLFILLNDTPTQSEEEWMSWLDVYHSGAGYSWDHDIVSVQQLFKGKTNLSHYAVLVMSEYKESSALKPVIDQHVADGGHVILLGKANQEGMFDLCQSNLLGAPYPDKNVNIALNDHYITSKYPIASLQVFTIDSKMYYVKEDYIGSPLAISANNEGFTILGVNEGFLSWGPERPFRFNKNGIELTTRAIDFAIMDSTKGVG